MKKKLLLTLLTTFILSKISLMVVQAETISYPFASIAITTATTFDISIPAAMDDASLLNDFEGQNASVYMATLLLQSNSEDAGTTTTMLILSVGETDIARYIVNNMSWNGDTMVRTYGFANHILIDPAIGVIKDMDIMNQNPYELGLIIEELTINYTFLDNLQTAYPMMIDSLTSEDNLDIVIAAYTDEVINESRTPYVDRTLLLTHLLSLQLLTGCSSTSSMIEMRNPLSHDSLMQALSESIKALF